MSVPVWVALIPIIIFGIYFLIVREELKSNNKLIHGYRAEIASRDGKIEEEVSALFDRTSISWERNDDGQYEEQRHPSQLEEGLTRILSASVKKHINSEEFIDNVVKRINNKQVG